jgi:D-alanine-D-alanine ligase
MRIGLTYDLRESYLQAGYGEEETAEFDCPETIQALTAALQELGHEPAPIGNLRQLAKCLVAGERWELVFNIAEGLQGFGREAQVPALLEAYGIPYTFSDSLVLALSLHKAMAKRVIRDCGIATADFVVVETEQAVASVALPYPVFAKPLAEGTGKGISALSKVHSPAELRRICQHLLARYRQPVLVETYLPGREFSVGLIGTGPQAEVLGVLEVLLKNEAEANAYSYHNKEHYETLVNYRLVSDALADELATLALAAWRCLGCRDGGRVDLRLDEKGKPHFLEINPLAGLHPKRSDLPILCRLIGIDYNELIRRIVESACARCPTRPIPGITVDALGMLL